MATGEIYELFSSNYGFPSSLALLCTLWIAYLLYGPQPEKAVLYDVQKPRQLDRHVPSEVGKNSGGDTPVGLSILSR